MYQCERGIIRNWRDLNNSPCTSNCKCRKGEVGCGSNDNACHGSLVCKANKCMQRSTSSGGMRGPYLIWQSDPEGAADDFRCIDVKNGKTFNGNAVWYYKCNFTPSQLWYRDDNNYIRSSLNKNKCLIGSKGHAALGTKLIIHDCFENDDRFRWIRYTGGAIRPKNNDQVCIEVASAGTSSEVGHPLILDGCHSGYKSWNWMQHSQRRKLLSDDNDNSNDMYNPRDSTQVAVVPQERTLEFESEEQDVVGLFSANDCEDSPVGWYDIFGRNCDWYAGVGSNCAVYGTTTQILAGQLRRPAVCAQEVNRRRVSSLAELKKWHCLISLKRNLAGINPTGTTRLAMDAHGIMRTNTTANTMVTSF